MINYDKVAEKIFAIIKGFGYDLSMFTIDGMDTSIPSDGRRFYVKKPNFMVTLDEETDEIKINKNSRVTLEEIESVMKQLKNLAKQNLLNTQVKVFGKEITPKDFAYQAKKFKDNTMENVFINEGGRRWEAFPNGGPGMPDQSWSVRRNAGKTRYNDKNYTRTGARALATRLNKKVTEASLSRMSGSKKTSYQTLESVKVIVRHRKPVAEDKRGARSRQIQAIFLEQGGERVRFPHNNLIGARAMARHMYEGGNFEDTLGSYIVETVGSILKLNEFVRYARTNKLINEENQDVVKTVKENIATLRRELHGLTGAKTYARVSEKIATREVNVLEEDDVTDLQDMFTVKKFDEKLSNTLPLVRKLMNEKQAWRNALIEASTQTVLMHEKEELAEDDLMEFDNPVQQVGYKIQRVAKRMVEAGDLQKFVGRVAGKLIEGQAINEFEKTVVRNVLENATIEEAKVCEECGEVTCECNTFESVMENYALKIKMLEHEDIFAEASEEPDVGCDSCNETGKNEDDESCANCDGKGRHPASGGLFEGSKLNEKRPGKGYWDKFYGRPDYHKKKKSNVKEEADENVLTKVDCPECGDFSMDLQDKYGDDFHYVCNTCGHEKTEHLPKTKEQYCPDCNGTGIESNTIFGDDECSTCGGSGSTDPLQEEEGEKCIRCRKGTMQPGDTMMGPAKECDRCNYQVQVNEAGFDDHHAGEVAAGAHSGMPSNDQVEAEADVQDVVDEVVSDILSSPDRGSDEILELVASHFQDYNDPLIDVAYGQVIDRIEGIEDEDDGQPSEYDEWQDYMGGDDWDQGQFDESLNELRKAAGIEIKEDDSEQCSECGGIGEVWGKACEKCGGEGGA